MSEYRHIRNEIRVALETERHKADEEIKRLHDEYRSEVQRLEQEQRRQTEEYNRKLIDLEKEQVRAMQAAQAWLEQRLKEEHEQLQLKIEDIRRQTNIKIQEQKREFEKRLRNMYEVVDKRVTEVLNKIRKIEEDEQNLAKESCDEAISEYNSMIKDADACQFQIDIINNILKSMLESCRRAYSLHNWAAATGKALLLQTECKRTVNAAKANRREWDRRRMQISERLSEIDKELSRMEDPDTAVTAVGLEHLGSLKSWNQEIYQKLQNEVQSIHDVFMNIPAGDFADLVNLEMSIIRLETGNFIGDAIDSIVLAITAHLMAIKVLAAFSKVELGRGEWSFVEDSEEIEKDHCSVAVENENDEIIKAEIYINEDALKQGQIRFSINTSIIGTKSDKVLYALLADFWEKLQEMIYDSQFGYLRGVDKHEYTDEEGYPGYGMDLIPDGTRKGVLKVKIDTSTIDSKMTMYGKRQEDEKEGESL